MQPRDQIDFIDIHINARQNSPFCQKKEKIPTGDACQTAYMIPDEYLTTFPIPFGYDIVCEHPEETCIKTNGNEDSGRGVCAPEAQKVGCGNGCPGDEYCAMTSSIDVARGKFSPHTVSEVAWPAAPRDNIVTVICPLLGNVARWSGQPLVASPPFRRYDTPFCTCKKRLAEGSECQYSFDGHGKYRLDLVVDPELPPNINPILVVDSELPPNLNPELRSRRIDVGCEQNHVCKREQSNASIPNRHKGISMISIGSDYGVCRQHVQN
jgi:hypothetical protein